MLADLRRLNPLKLILIGNTLVFTLVGLIPVVYSDEMIQAKIQSSEEIPSAVVYSFPEGTIVRATLLTKLSAQTAFRGQLVEARISQPVYIGEEVVLTQDDKLIGTIENSLMPRNGQNGLFSIRFNRLVLDNQFEFPLSATTLTYQNHSYFGGEGTVGTQPERVLYKNTGMPDYDGYVLRGIREKGANIIFNPGDQVTLKLDRALQFYRSK